MEEEWRIIPSRPEYEASSLGRIRRVPFYSEAAKRWYTHFKPNVGQWDEVTQRYVMVFKRKTYRVARLVCEAFNGPPPPDKPNCNHDDENPRNNKPGNLVWGTQEDNLNYPGFIRYCRSRTGSNNPHVKGRNKHADFPSA